MSHTSLSAVTVLQEIVHASLSICRDSASLSSPSSFWSVPNFSFTQLHTEIPAHCPAVRRLALLLHYLQNSWATPLFQSTPRSWQWQFQFQWNLLRHLWEVFHFRFCFFESRTTKLNLCLTTSGEWNSLNWVLDLRVLFCVQSPCLSCQKRSGRANLYYGSKVRYHQMRLQHLPVLWGTNSRDKGGGNTPYAHSGHDTSETLLEFHVRWDT